MPAKSPAVIGPLAVPLSFASPAAVKTEGAWPELASRVWIGADLWAGRLHEWRIRAGCLECIETATNMQKRTAHLLTADRQADARDLETRARLRMPGKGHAAGRVNLKPGGPIGGLGQS